MARIKRRPYRYKPKAVPKFFGVGIGRRTSGLYSVTGRSKAFYSLRRNSKKRRFARKIVLNPYPYYRTRVRFI